MKKTFQHLFYHGTVLLQLYPLPMQLLPQSEQQSLLCLCDFLFSETENKSLSRLSPGHSSWSSGSVQRIHLMSQTCFIQIESYTLFPKICRKLETNFSSKLKPQFQVIFGQDSFPLNTSPFQASLLQNSANCVLINGWWNACFYHYSFYRKVSHLFLQELGLS